MYLYSSKLTEYNIDATDGEMGKIHDLYFDEEKWAVRYAVVDARKWLPSRRVLLSPESFAKIDKKEKLVEVKHDKETVRNSPHVPGDVAISRDVETALTGYYGWSRYWVGSMLWGTQDRPAPILPQEANAQDELREKLHLNETKEENDLRSSNETLMYRVHANDGKAGKVADLIVDEKYWKIYYLLIQMDGFPAEDKLIVIEPKHIQSIDWYEGDIYINCDLAEVNKQTGYDTKEDVLNAIV